MDKTTRNAIERATQQARRLLEEDFSLQLEGTFDVLRTGIVPGKGGVHLTPAQQTQREKIVAAIEHKRAAGMTEPDAITDYIRDAAFTTLNRYVALKMLETRGLVQECITKGEDSAGYREFYGMAPGISLLPDSAGYRLYIECLFDEFSTEIKVLFDRRDAASVLWPDRETFERLLAVLNAQELSGVWNDDETIGWVFQFFNSGEERRKMRELSQAPRNSREMAVRNQFFTPRYVVQFLVDNTLGRLWMEMLGEKSQLASHCEYFVRPEDEEALTRARKDPRDLRVLDPACGSGHFLLYSFDLLLRIYEEAWENEDTAPVSESTGRTLRTDYPTLDDLRRAGPRLIVENNLYGVDIDPRCAQIAALVLWLRAQRAWKELGIAASERPPIERTHIVLAEPMPGDAALVEEFAAEELNPPIYRDLFKKMVQECRLAGELGALLRVEDGIAAELSRAREQFVKQRRTPGFLPGMEPSPGQGSFDLTGMDDAAFFHEAEGMLFEALPRFVEAASGKAAVRRRLFVGDAAQGIALIETLRTRFDVVLMNPPFGLGTAKSKPVMMRLYPDTWTDLYAAFIVRAIELSTPKGLIGAITSNLWLNIKRHTYLRKLVSSVASLRSVADLGAGVLDGATVNTALSIIDVNVPSSPHKVAFCRASVPDERESVLRGRQFEQVDLAVFKEIPTAPYCFDLGSTRIRQWTVRRQRLDPDLATAFKGNATFDNFRFIRCWWEVSPTEIGSKWVRYDKGGEFQPFFSPSVLVWRFDNNAAENRAFQMLKYGTDAQVLQSAKFWRESGLCYSRATSVGFSPRVLASDHVVNDKSIAILPRERKRTMALLGLLASTHIEDLLYAFGDYRNIEKGAVASLPLSQVQLTEKLGELALHGFRNTWTLEASKETSPIFVRPMRSNERSEAIRNIVEAAEAIDPLVQEGLYGREEVNPISTPKPLLIREILSRRFSESSEDLRHHWLSHAIGVAFGRWDASKSEEPLDAFITTEPDAPFPSSPPGASATYSSGDSIFCLDEGHSSDLEKVVLASLQQLNGPLLDFSELRTYLETRFFSAHIATYTQSGRQAPIYWQLATRSASYSVWLYLHSLTKDTLHKVQNDFTGPKLAHEVQRLELIRIEFGGNPNSGERKKIAAQEQFVEELRSFDHEVRRVAELWTPSVDDGVIINFAPLWRLVPQHKAWQKELKTTWEALCAGDFDWTHLAMHLWPERVVPKCATDRSCAIAHGLEDVFWQKDQDDKWQPRPTPTHPVDELVHERSSQAVKAALKALLESAETAAPARRRGRNGKRAPA